MDKKSCALKLCIFCQCTTLMQAYGGCPSISRIMEGQPLSLRLPLHNPASVGDLFLLKGSFSLPLLPNKLLTGGHWIVGFLSLAHVGDSSWIMGNFVGLVHRKMLKQLEKMRKHFFKWAQFCFLFWLFINAEAFFFLSLGQVKPSGSNNINVCRAVLMS